MAAVYTGERTFLDPVMRYPERLLYRVLRVDPNRGQDWKSYAKSLIIFSFVGWLALYFILRTQGLWSFTGLNPMGFHSAPWNVTFNTASSFLTNTNWQYYGGETTMSYFSQMAGLTVQNFASAAVGIVVAVALIRGIVKRVSDRDAADANSLGNFWQDLVRTILYILLPISFVVALVLIWQGSIQNFSHYLSFTGITHLGQTIAMGPVASQEAIKLLGTNGGGFFNANSAHPFENPTAFTNFVEMLTVLVIPAALVFTYGRMVGNRRQGYAIYGTMMVMFLGAVIVCYIAEAHGSPAQHAAGLHTGVIAGSSGGNLEGKEQRFGIAGSALFDVVTTVTSCGAVNSAIESFTGHRRRGSVCEPERQRGDLRRRRHRALLDPPVRPARGLHRRSDGRPHARVHRQEDRGPGDQAGRARDPDNAVGGAVLNSAGDCIERRPSVDRYGGRRVGRRASARRSTPTLARPTTTARRSPATPASSSPMPATSARTGSRSPTCWAASRCCSPGTRRSCSRWRSPEHWRASG